MKQAPSFVLFSTILGYCSFDENTDPKAKECLQTVNSNSEQVNSTERTNQKEISDQPFITEPKQIKKINRTNR